MIRLENVSKVSLQDVLKRSWRRFEDVFKTSWKRLEDVLARRLEEVLKTSWKRLKDVLKTYGQDEYIGLNQNVLKTSSEDLRLRRTYSSWPRRLEDVFWRRRQKTSSIRLQDVFIKIIRIILFALLFSFQTTYSRLAKTILQLSIQILKIIMYFVKRLAVR